MKIIRKIIIAIFISIMVMVTNVAAGEVKDKVTTYTTDIKDKCPHQIRNKLIKRAVCKRYKLRYRDGKK